MKGRVSASLDTHASGSWTFDECDDVAAVAAKTKEFRGDGNPVV